MVAGAVHPDAEELNTWCLEAAKASGRKDSGDELTPGDMSQTSSLRQYELEALISRNVLRFTGSMMLPEPLLILAPTWCRKDWYSAEVAQMYEPPLGLQEKSKRCIEAHQSFGSTTFQHGWHTVSMPATVTEVALQMVPDNKSPLPNDGPFTKSLGEVVAC
ncbi:hypothetical protein BGX38DRAFT_1275545 [Terfezia claveryi]|nr:hypothetical protein BGX38DRAFT_1275545 [Terfezia claveryi]